MGQDVSKATQDHLHEAILAKSQDRVRKLLKGGDPAKLGINGADSKGDLAVHLAAAAGDKPMVELLTSSGASLTKQDSQGRNALHYCGSKRNKDNADITEFLLKTEGGSSNFLNQKDHVGRTPLYIACHNGALLVVQHLLKERNIGASVTSRDDHKRTPLHEAASRGYVEIVKLLVSQGAPLLDVDRDGGTPLDLAVQRAANATAMKSNNKSDKAAGPEPLLTDEQRTRIVATVDFLKPLVAQVKKDEAARVAKLKAVAAATRDALVASAKAQADAATSAKAQADAAMIQQVKAQRVAKKTAGGQSSTAGGRGQNLPKYSKPGVSWSATTLRFAGTQFARAAATIKALLTSRLLVVAVLAGLVLSLGAVCVLVLADTFSLAGADLGFSFVCTGFTLVLALEFAAACLAVDFVETKMIGRRFRQALACVGHLVAFLPTSVPTLAFFVATWSGTSVDTMDPELLLRCFGFVAVLLLELVTVSWCVQAHRDIISSKFRTRHEVAWMVAYAFVATMTLVVLQSPNPVGAAGYTFVLVLVSPLAMEVAERFRLVDCRRMFPQKKTSTFFLMYLVLATGIGGLVVSQVLTTDYCELDSNTSGEYSFGMERSIANSVFTMMNSLDALAKLLLTTLCAPGVLSMISSLGLYATVGSSTVAQRILKKSRTAKALLFHSLLAVNQYVIYFLVASTQEGEGEGEEGNPTSTSESGFYLIPPEVLLLSALLCWFVNSASSAKKDTCPPWERVDRALTILGAAGVTLSVAALGDPKFSFPLSCTGVTLLLITEFFSVCSLGAMMEKKAMFGPFARFLLSLAVLLLLTVPTLSFFVAWWSQEEVRNEGLIPLMTDPSLLLRCTGFTFLILLEAIDTVWVGRTYKQVNFGRFRSWHDVVLMVAFALVMMLNLVVLQSPNPLGTSGYSLILLFFVPVIVIMSPLLLAHVNRFLLICFVVLSIGLGWAVLTQATTAPIEMIPQLEKVEIIEGTSNGGDLSAVLTHGTNISSLPADLSDLPSSSTDSHGGILPSLDAVIWLILVGILTLCALMGISLLREKYNPTTKHSKKRNPAPQQQQQNPESGLPESRSRTIRVARMVVALNGLYMAAVQSSKDRGFPIPQINPVALTGKAGDKFREALKVTGYANVSELLDKPGHFIVGFHGTKSLDAIVGIFNTGFDPARRSGQAYGPGEYFDIGTGSVAQGFWGHTKCLVASVIIVLHKDGRKNQLYTEKNYHGSSGGKPIAIVNNPLSDALAYQLPVGVVSSAANSTAADQQAVVDAVKKRYASELAEINQYRQ